MLLIPPMSNPKITHKNHKNIKANYYRGNSMGGLLFITVEGWSGSSGMVVGVSTVHGCCVGLDG